MSRFKRLGVVLLLALCLLLSSSPGLVALAASAPSYTVVNLGQFVPTDINNAGQIVGYTFECCSTEHAVLWEHGHISGLGALPGATGSSSSATAINEGDQIVGWSSTGAGYEHAVLWEHGQITDLGALPGDPYSRAIAINNRGEIIGLSSDSNNVRHGVLWEPRQVTDLAGAVVALTAPPQRYTLVDLGQQFWPTAINNKGDIVGDVDSNFQYRAALWNHGQTADLGALPNPYGSGSAYATGINNRGQIVGYSWAGTAPGPDLHAVLWDHGQITDLGTLPFPPGHPRSIANDINERGQIVGNSYNIIGDPAVLWEDGQIFELTGGVDAVAVNDSGQIVGTTGNPYGNAVLWQP